MESFFFGYEGGKVSPNLEVSVLHAVVPILCRHEERAPGLRRSGVHEGGGHWETLAVVCGHRPLLFKKLRERPRRDRALAESPVHRLSPNLHRKLRQRPFPNNNNLYTHAHTTIHLYVESHSNQHAPRLPHNDASMIS